MFIGKPVYQTLSTTKFDCECILAKIDNITMKKLIWGEHIEEVGKWLFVGSLDRESNNISRRLLRACWMWNWSAMSLLISNIIFLSSVSLQGLGKSWSAKFGWFVSPVCCFRWVSTSTQKSSQSIPMDLLCDPLKMGVSPCMKSSFLCREISYSTTQPPIEISI